MHQQRRQGHAGEQDQKHPVGAIVPAPQGAHQGQGKQREEGQIQDGDEPPGQGQEGGQACGNPDPEEGREPRARRGRHPGPIAHRGEKEAGDHGPDVAEEHLVGVPGGAEVVARRGQGTGQSGELLSPRQSRGFPHANNPSLVQPRRNTPNIGRLNEPRAMAQSVAVTSVGAASTSVPSVGVASLIQCAVVIWMCAQRY